MNVHTYSDRETLIQEFSAILVKKLQSISPTHIPSVALSGGRTPILLFQQLREQYAAALDWSRILFFWGDERYVPLNDPESNAGVALRELLIPLGVPEKHIFPMYQDTLSAEAAAAAYSNRLREHLPQHEGVPILDIAIQGVGEDGHTASLFPGMPIPASNPLCFATKHPQTQQDRVTMSMDMINRAKNIWVLALDASKTAIIRRIVHDRDTSLPATSLSSQASWFLVSTSFGAMNNHEDPIGSDK